MNSVERNTEDILGYAEDKLREIKSDVDDANVSDKVLKICRDYKELIKYMEKNITGATEKIRDLATKVRHCSDLSESEKHIFAKYEALAKHMKEEIGKITRKHRIVWSKRGGSRRTRRGSRRSSRSSRRSKKN